MPLASFLSSVLGVTGAVLPEKKEAISAEKEEERLDCYFVMDLQIHTIVVSEPRNDFSFPVLLSTGGWTSRVTPDFSIPDSRSSWIWLREASSKPSLFISV
ncbi:hypothetical protein M9H77_29824 [Catharanthus roseus]|uniref:Uncharacterized protein n=1 Tax=Catharanthus roseus TaxID=4058 RepID=A0ACB9ZY43_CATRO|nr:hypothetical protein M9H77_29824 [Catharanthus roseus]